MSESSTCTFWRPGGERPPLPSAEDRSDLDPLSATTFVYGGGSGKRPHELQQQRRRLPVFRWRTHILYALDRYRTLVLVGETGCGKSTQVPQYCHDSGWTRSGRSIAVVEPRRVAATSLASRVADETGCRLGTTVGYSVRFDECCNSADTRIKYLTDGMLMREMMIDPLLRSYSVVMVDEVHERGVNTDICLALLRKILRKRSDLRVIVCSATVDAEEMAEFFNVGAQEEGNVLSSTVLAIPGRQYPVDIFYSSDPVADYVTASVRTAIDIHEQQPRGDVLVFLTGQDEVDEVVERLTDATRTDNARKSDQLLALPMYGSLPASDQLRVFQRAPAGHRKVIVATNIAEASITIPGIVYVVDCGFVKRRWLSAADGHTSSLVVCPTSQAAAQQRAGRAGRERSGQAYRLYTRDQFDLLPPHCVPEVRRAPLAGCLLQLRALGVQNVARLALPSPPPARSMLLAAELLYALEALRLDCSLTDMGRRMCELPLSPIHARLLLVGEQFNCCVEMATLVAMLQVERCLAEPRGGRAAVASRVAHRTFQVVEGDLLTYLNIHRAFVKSDCSRQWCHKMFVNHRAMLRVMEIRRRLVGVMRKFGVEIDDHSESMRSAQSAETILKCIASGLFANAAYLHHSGEYRCARSNIPLCIHRSSVLYDSDRPSWLVYGEIMHTTQTYIKDLTAVSSQWLLDAAPHYYHVTTVSRS